VPARGPEAAPRRGGSEISLAERAYAGHSDAMGAFSRKMLAALLLPLLGACGDGTLVVFVNSGVIVGSPRCTASGGEFDLRDDGGLVLVVITDGTDVVVAGRVGGCPDLFAGANASVEGRQSGGRIIASSVTVD